MTWESADTETFSSDDVANTAIAVEGHDHTSTKGLAVGRLRVSGSLASNGDVLVGSTDYTYKDNSGSNHTLLTADVGKTITAAETFSSTITFNGATDFNGANDFSSAPATTGLKAPVAAGAAPTVSGQFAYDSTANAYVGGANGSTVTFSTGTAVPTGALLAYAAGTTDPTGFLLCDGRAINRTTFATLFAVTSTAYGIGNGSTTFNIPDLRSRVIMAADNAGTSAGAASRTSTNNALGNTSGEDTHALTTGELASHSHTSTGLTATDGGHTHVNTFNDAAHVHSLLISYNGGNGGHTIVSTGLSNGTAPGNRSDVNDAGEHLASSVSTGASISNASATASITVGGSTATNGSGTAHNNRSLCQVVNHVIKT